MTLPQLLSIARSFWPWQCHSLWIYQFVNLPVWENAPKWHVKLPVCRCITNLPVCQFTSFSFEVTSLRFSSYQFERFAPKFFFSSYQFYKKKFFNLPVFEVTSFTIYQFRPKSGNWVLSIYQFENAIFGLARDFYQFGEVPSFAKLVSW